MKVLAGLQSSFGIVCNLLDKGFWGGWVDICPIVVHNVVEECVWIFDHRVCTPRSRTLRRQIVELLRLGGWPGHGVCSLPNSLRRYPTVSTSYPVWQHYGILEGGVGVSSSQDVVEILLHQFPCWIC